jgi:hypothetical protein
MARSSVPERRDRGQKPSLGGVGPLKVQVGMLDDLAEFTFMNAEGELAVGHRPPPGRP